MRRKSHLTKYFELSSTNQEQAVTSKPLPQFGGYPQNTFGTASADLNSKNRLTTIANPPTSGLLSMDFQGSFGVPPQNNPNNRASQQQLQDYAPLQIQTNKFNDRQQNQNRTSRMSKNHIDQSLNQTFMANDNLDYNPSEQSDSADFLLSNNNFRMSDASNFVSKQENNNLVKTNQSGFYMHSSILENQKENLDPLICKDSYTANDQFQLFNLVTANASQQQQQQQQMASEHENQDDKYAQLHKKMKIQTDQVNEGSKKYFKHQQSSDNFDNQGNHQQQLQDQDQIFDKAVELYDSTVSKYTYLVQAMEDLTDQTQLFQSLENKDSYRQLKLKFENHNQSKLEKIRSDYQKSEQQTNQVKSLLDKFQQNPGVTIQKENLQWTFRMEFGDGSKPQNIILKMLMNNDQKTIKQIVQVEGNFNLKEANLRHFEGKSLFEQDSVDGEISLMRYLNQMKSQFSFDF